MVPYDKILFGIDKLRNLINEVEMTVIAHQRLNKKMYAPHQLYILNYTKEVHTHTHFLRVVKSLCLTSNSRHTYLTVIKHVDFVT